MEIRDLYDLNKNLTGKTFVKGEQVPKGYYYLIVSIILENSNGEFLIQKRVSRKGGKWALTAGHPKSGENSLEGLCSEVSEELGIDISNDKPKLIETWINNDQIFDIYYLKKDIDLEDIVIQEEEVDGVRYATMEEIMEMHAKEKFHENHFILFSKCMENLGR
jgi:8-oxo-dGTP pyrophosphatase MutT (NUDIX family)